MKVLFVFGGIPHYYNKILNKLNKEKDLNISVLIPAKDSNVIGKGVYQTNIGIEFSLFQLQEYQTIFGKPFFKGFEEFLKQHKPDVVVSGWPYILSFALNPRLRLLMYQLKISFVLKDIPFLVPKYNEAKSFYWNYDEINEEMSPSQQNIWLRRLKYFVLTQARKIYYNYPDAHVNYTEEAFGILGSYGVKKDRIFIIYNSPDTDELFEIKDKIKNNPRILAPNPHRIIHVGRLVKWKRVDLLISAVKILQNKYPQIELLVIGTGPEKDNLINQSKELGVEPNIKFIGAIYENEILGQYLTESAIYVLAGMGGLSLNDAMCFGKPIICSVCDGTEKKLVQNNRNGFIFQNGNVGDLANKIDTLLSNPDLVEKMGQMSVSIIKNEVNVNVVIDNYKKAFKYISKQGKESINRTK